MKSTSIDKNFKRISRRTSGGFTLVEILTVVGVIAVISALVFAYVNVSRKSGRDARRLSDVAQLKNSLELYYTDHTRYPVSLDLLVPDYIPSLPRDPSGGTYRYSALGAADICGSYHLGADLETSHNILNTDADLEPSAVCDGSASDFSGKEVVSCGGEAGSDRCYDFTPEYLAVLALQQGGGGPAAAGEGEAPPSGEEGTGEPFNLVTLVAGTEGAAGEHFTFSTKGRPSFLEADIQPRDVKVGDTQFLRVKVYDPDGILSVIAFTELDHSVKALALQPEAGAQVGCTECSWSYSWTVQDTSFKTYHTVFTARSQTANENSVTIAWTDPCSPPLGGGWTLDSNCIMSGVNGVDNGNLIIDSGYTMTLASGSTWAFNPGYSINFGPSGGTIALGTNSSLQSAYVWADDTDGDGYIATTEYIVSLTDPDGTPADNEPSVANWVQRSTATGTNDVNDTSATVYQTVACYQDSDNDTYTTGTAQNVDCGSACGTGCAGWRASANGSDCNDASASVWQNLTGYADSDGDGYGGGVAQQLFF